MFFKFLITVHYISLNCIFLFISFCFRESILQAVKERKKEGIFNVMKLFILINEYGQDLLQKVFVFEISKEEEEEKEEEAISRFFASQKQRLLDLSLKQGKNSIPLKTADLMKIFTHESIKMQCDIHVHMQETCCCNFHVRDNIDLLILDFDVSLMSCILLNCLKLQKINMHISQLRTQKNKLSHMPREKIYSGDFNSEWEKAAESIIGISTHLGNWYKKMTTTIIKKLRLNDDIGIPKVRNSRTLFIHVTYIFKSKHF